LPRSLRPVRRAVREFLRAVGATEDEVADLVLAAGEAAANVVEHAYGPAGGVLEVRLAEDDGTVSITVRDEGDWREARGANRGRGLPLMHGLVDAVRVGRDLGGTTVRLTRTLAGEQG
ncbi:ATP-binding protein, partial [Pseudonocardia pini]|uniref:ATP-binding protein n=1 Tax=Pseudonocardia pini TaxID=2758030 RepID=UPI0015EFF809